MLHRPHEGQQIIIRISYNCHQRVTQVIERDGAERLQLKSRDPCLIGGQQVSCPISIVEGSCFCPVQPHAEHARTKLCRPANEYMVSPVVYAAVNWRIDSLPQTWAIGNGFAIVRTSSSGASKHIRSAPVAMNLGRHCGFNCRSASRTPRSQSEQAIGVLCTSAQAYLTRRESTAERQARRALNYPTSTRGVYHRTFLRPPLRFLALNFHRDCPPRLGRPDAIRPSQFGPCRLAS